MPQGRVEWLHSVYTCAAVRQDAQKHPRRMGSLHSLLASVLTLVAGQLLVAALQQQPPSFVTHWRTAVPLKMLLPWALVNALPAPVFRRYGTSGGGAVVAALVNAHEALSKYRGLLSALHLARHLPAAALLLFVAARGAASASVRHAHAWLRTSRSRAEVFSRVAAVVKEHLRYLVLCCVLRLAPSLSHPAHELLDRAGHVWREWGLTSSSAALWAPEMQAEHVEQGTRALVLMYLLAYYMAKVVTSLPARTPRKLE